MHTIDDRAPPPPGVTTRQSRVATLADYAYALIVLQLALAALNIRGALKNESQLGESASHA
jgi:hypothetical protein